MGLSPLNALGLPAGSLVGSPLACAVPLFTCCGVVGGFGSDVLRPDLVLTMLLDLRMDKGEH